MKVVRCVLCCSLLASSFAGVARATSTTIQVSDASGSRGAGGISVEVSTAAAITAGSTDLVLSFDASALEATAASSGTLSSFAFFIDNGAGQVRTASASAAGDSLNAGATLFTVTFSVRPNAPLGISPVGIQDADGPPCDLGGVVPPIPAPVISCDVVPGEFTVTVLGCPLNVDGSGKPVGVATDIVYMARRLLGLSAVPASFRDLDPSIPSDVHIGAQVDALGALADVDANGAVAVATDVVYIARRLLGLPPVPASFRSLDPSIPPDAEIAARIDGLCS